MHHGCLLRAAAAGGWCQDFGGRKSEFFLVAEFDLNLAGDMTDLHVADLAGK